jgi:hypothetical protein
MFTLLPVIFVASGYNTNDICAGKCFSGFDLGGCADV